jgi:Domain of unknown function (DUF1987).
MESLILEKTNSTPALVFSKAGNTFKIYGKSLPENALGFYQPIITRLNILT